MKENNNLGCYALGNDWQKIEAYPAEEYAKDLAAELKTLSEVIEQLNISADTKLPSNKKMLLNVIRSVVSARVYIETLIEMKKSPERKVSDLLH